LRLKWVGDASAAAAVGVVGDAVAESTVGGAFEEDDFVFVGVVSHDEDGAGRVAGLCRGESWKCSANSDGEDQETSSYVQHFCCSL
jgi:predicted secreted protein